VHTAISTFFSGIKFGFKFNIVPTSFIVLFTKESDAKTVVPPSLEPYLQKGDDADVDDNDDGDDYDVGDFDGDSNTYTIVSSATGTRVVEVTRNPWKIFTNSFV
jgi:hypothetical protein